MKHIQASISCVASKRGKGVEADDEAWRAAAELKEEHKD